MASFPSSYTPSSFEGYSSDDSVVDLVSASGSTASPPGPRAPSRRGKDAANGPAPDDLPAGFAQEGRPGVQNQKFFLTYQCNQNQVPPELRYADACTTRDNVKTLFPGCAVFMAWTIEEGEDSDSWHCHFILHYASRITFNALCKKLQIITSGRVLNVQKQLGSNDQALAYLQKTHPQNFGSLGTPLAERKRKGQGDEVADDIVKQMREGKHFLEIEQVTGKDILYKAAPMQYAQMLLSSVKADELYEGPLRNVFVQGPAGIGKSWAMREFFAQENLENYSKDTSSAWFPMALKPRGAILFDDIGPQSVKQVGGMSFMKALCDRYPSHAQFKGGQSLILPAGVFFTSNYSFEKVFGPNIEDLEAMGRRVHVIVLEGGFPHTHESICEDITKKWRSGVEPKYVNPNAVGGFQE